MTGNHVHVYMLVSEVKLGRERIADYTCMMCGERRTRIIPAAHRWRKVKKQ